MTDNEFIDEVYKLVFGEGDRETQNEFGDDHEKALKWMKADKGVVGCVIDVSFFFDFDMYDEKKLGKKLEYWSWIESVFDPEVIQDIHNHNLSFKRLPKEENHNGQ